MAAIKIMTIPQKCHWVTFDLFLLSCFQTQYAQLVHQKWRCSQLLMPQRLIYSSLLSCFITSEEKALRILAFFFFLNIFSMLLNKAFKQNLQAFNLNLLSLSLDLNPSFEYLRTSTWIYPSQNLRNLLKLKVVWGQSECRRQEISVVCSIHAVFLQLYFVLTSDQSWTERLYISYSSRHE